VPRIRSVEPMKDIRRQVLAQSAGHSAAEIEAAHRAAALAAEQHH